MREFLTPMKMFVLMFVVGCSFSFTACSNDDENIPPVPDEITTKTMFGDYSGKMTSWNIVPQEGEDNEEDTPTGTDISATVKNDTVHLEKFPIKDIVLSIVKDETLADKIVEAVGDVNYKVGYEPTLTTAKDSIKLKLNPEPLKLSITIPTDTEGEEAQPLLIEVKVEPGEEAGYAVESANMKFYFAATKVLLGEGKDQLELPGFTPTTFHFDMNQHKAVQNF